MILILSKKCSLSAKLRKFSRKFFSASLWSNSLVVKELDFLSKGPRFQTTKKLQGQFSLSSFQGYFQALLTTPVLKLKIEITEKHCDLTFDLR